MFNQSVILRGYTHLFNNVVLVHAVTAILTILFSCFITFHEKVCVIKWRLNWLFFVIKITDKGSDLLGVI